MIIGMEREETADAIGILRRRAEELLPLHEEYLRVNRALLALAPPTPGARAVDGDVGSLVLSMMTPGEEVSPSIVCSRLLERGEALGNNQVSNALHYLARSGRVRRLGRGRYRLEQEGV